MTAPFLFFASVPPCHADLSPGHHLSVHAWQRMCARGISPAAVRAVLQHGRVIHQRRAVYHVIGRLEVASGRRLGLNLGPFEGVHVVVAQDGTIKTAFRNRELSEIERDWRATPRRGNRRKHAA